MESCNQCETILTAPLEEMAQKMQNMDDIFYLRIVSRLKNNVFLLKSG